MKKAQIVIDIVSDGDPTHELELLEEHLDGLLEHLEVTYSRFQVSPPKEVNNRQVKAIMKRHGDEDEFDGYFG